MILDFFEQLLLIFAYHLIVIEISRNFSWVIVLLFNFSLSLIHSLFLSLFLTVCIVSNHILAEKVFVTVLSEI